MKSGRIQFIHVLGALLFCVVAAYIFIRVKYEEIWGRSGVPKTQCISNLKQIATGMNLYVEANNGRFPKRTWVEEVKPRGSPNFSFTCPKVQHDGGKWGYAMSYKLMGKEMSSVQNPEVPMFFEIDALAKNVIANVEARARARHNGRSTVARLDTSTKTVPAADIVADLP